MPNRLENQMSQNYRFKFLSERKSSKYFNGKWLVNCYEYS